MAQKIPDDWWNVDAPSFPIKVQLITNAPRRTEFVTGPDPDLTVSLAQLPTFVHVERVEVHDEAGEA